MNKNVRNALIKAAKAVESAARFTVVATPMSEDYHGLFIASIGGQDCVGFMLGRSSRGSSSAVFVVDAPGAYTIKARTPFEGRVTIHPDAEIALGAVEYDAE
jgi:hypothetical protein